jgi:hypothetical protein
MCLRRAPEKYIAGAALDRAALTAPRLLIILLYTLTVSILIASNLKERKKKERNVFELGSSTGLLSAM